MQFIVFAAFAIVLSVPDSGPPWHTLRNPLATWAIMLGQVPMAALVAALYSRRVLVKLEREPAWLPGAQRLLAQGNAAIRGTLVLGLCASLYMTPVSAIVRRWPMMDRFFGLDEMVLLLPFLCAIVVSWTILYPADRAVRRVSLELQLWASVPAHPVWSLWSYLNFMLRQNVLIIFMPMLPIVVANDFVNAYSRPIREFTRIAWADQAVLVIIAGVVFFFAPVLLRYIWHTRPLPGGELRHRLEDLCRRIGLTYREILVWQSDGMVVNAAVMGLFRPVRYILLSDGLIEMMEDEKIEAVFGHEAGHIKCRHMHYYLLFAILSMLIVGGLTELVVRLRPDLIQNSAVFQDYLQVGAMASVVLIWLFGFGAVSRRFEWQADLFGARSVTPPPEGCRLPCFHHATAEIRGPDPQHPVPTDPVCATGADTFADALTRIAVLNGIPLEARSWRHSSIANRVRLLRSYAHEPVKAAQLERSVLAIKALLLIGVLIGLSIGLKLYWPRTGQHHPPVKPPPAIESPAIRV
ncbi:MAG TPA: M48 family metallopeptidase [Phycisphaerae bacterium]|nr:M48 family metallopeptidase [Phycisphaerae bacterium]